MTIKLHNTLSGKKEDFVPLNSDEVRIYSCGPTVYDYAHIGNLRAYVFTDLLTRTLAWRGYKIKQAMNITDIGHLSGDGDEGEDKMTRALKREGKPMTMEAMRELALFYEKAFVSDLEALNIKKPEIMPRASENIEADIEIIKILEQKGLAYQISDGLYFDTAKFPEYGKLGNFSRAELRDGARVEGNAEKKSPRDFALWKFNGKLGFESPFGKGFPGWHIECSAMSRKFLGQPFDIHTGGVDHIGTHHNNEIAQSESAYGTIPARFWMHNEHLNMPDGKKMAKSAGMFLTLQSLREKGFSPLDFRYYLLGAHYRTPMKFSFEAMEGAKNARTRLISAVALLPDKGKEAKEPMEKFGQAVDDDIDSPEALSILWETLRDENIDPAEKKATILKFDEFLGLDMAGSIEKKKNSEAPPREISALLDKRAKAREEKNWRKADELRAEIEKLGYSVKDSATGQEIEKTTKD